MLLDKIFLISTTLVSSGASVTRKKGPSHELTKYRPTAVRTERCRKMLLAGKMPMILWRETALEGLRSLLVAVGYEWLARSPSHRLFYMQPLEC